MNFKLQTTLQYTLDVLLIYALLVEGNDASGVMTMDSVVTKNGCSRSLSHFLFHVCTGAIVVTDLPKSSLSKLRSKRSFVLHPRLKRQIANECCLNKCTIAQLVQYCPESW